DACRATPEDSSVEAVLRGATRAVGVKRIEGSDRSAHRSEGNGLRCPDAARRQEGGLAEEEEQIVNVAKALEPIPGAESFVVQRGKQSSRTAQDTVGDAAHCAC